MLVGRAGRARRSRYGDFGVEARGARDRRRRQAARAARRRRPAPDRRPLAPHRRHLRGRDRHRLPRRRRASPRRPPTLNTATTGELLARPHPRRRERRLRRPRASTPRALDAATIAAHFDASGNAQPARARERPRDRRRQRGHASTGPRPPAPPRRAAPVDHYVVEAWQGTTLRGAQAVDGARTTATLSGLPAGAYTLKVRAHQRLRHRPGRRGAPPPRHRRRHHLRGRGHRRRAGALLAPRASAAARSSPTPPATATPRLRRARPTSARSPAASSATPTARLGDGARGTRRYDLIRAPLAAGLPTGDRTVEALVRADRARRAAVRLRRLRGRRSRSAASIVAGARAQPSRRRRPPPHRQQVAPPRGHRTPAARSRAYLDGEAIATAARHARHDRHRRADAARIPAGANVVYDELAIYPRALDAADRSPPTSPSPATRRPRTARRPSRRSRRRCGRDHDDAPAAQRPPRRAARRRPARLAAASPAGDDVVLTARARRHRRRLVARRHAAAARRASSRSRSPSATRPATSARRRSTFTVANAAPDGRRSRSTRPSGTLPLTVRADIARAPTPTATRSPTGSTSATAAPSPARCRSPPVAHVYTRAGTHTGEADGQRRHRDGDARPRRSTTTPRRGAEGRRRRRPRRRGRQAAHVRRARARARPSASRATAGASATAARPTGAVVNHTFDDAGAQTATLEIGAGHATRAPTRAKITVLEPSPAVIATRAARTASPSRGADVLAILADGRRISATTGGDGKARLAGSPTARRRSTRGRTDMRPGSGTRPCSNGAGTAEITLVPGEVASAGLTSHRMTQHEIVAAGIDPNDPGNSAVYSFDGPHRDRRRDRLAARATCPRTASTAAAAAGAQCAAAAVAAAARTSYPSFQGGVPLLQWLVIPARTGFLKEFFDISMVVQNLASQEFTLRGGTASLDLPGGLSLAPTRTPQQASVALPDIRGGGDAATQLGRPRRQRGRLRAARPLRRDAGPDRPAGRARGAPGRAAAASTARRR